MVFGFSSGIRAAYSVLDNPSFVAEPWYVYPAKHKSNGKHVSVYIFDKSKFELQVTKLCSSRLNTKNPKLIASESIELLKYEVSQLSKLRHPQILTIYEVLEETKLKLIFASEQVVDSLLTVQMSKLDDITIQKGLLQVSKGLQFLHNQCHVVHFNLQPSSVFINTQGDWKIAGLRFSQNLNDLSPEDRENFFIMNNASIVPFANLNLNYTAPELLVSLAPKLTTANDLWSLGCLCYYLYNGGDQLISCFDPNSISDYKTEFKKFEQKFYNHRPSELKYLLKQIPEQFYPILTSVLARYPHDRPTIDQFIDSDFFNGSLIKAMWIIDEFSTKLADEKRVFLAGLLEGSSSQNLLSQFPAMFRTSKLLPIVIELIATEVNIPNDKPETDELVANALKIVFKIGESLSSLSFHDKIYEPLLNGGLKPKKQDKTTFAKLLNYTVKARLTIVENLLIIQSKLNDRQLTDMLGMSAELFLTSAPTEAAHKQQQILLQDTFLAQLPYFVKKFDFPYLKNTFFPLLCQVFKTTTVLSTKLTTIDVFLKYLQDKVIDKTIVTEQLLPILKNLKSRDKRIVKDVLALFGEICASSHIGLDTIPVVETILPQCWKLAFDCNDCSKVEFNQFVREINAIQKGAIDKKLATLPDTVPKHYQAESATPDFESMINTENINRNNQESMTKAPLSGVMLPTKREARTETTANAGANAGAKAETKARSKEDDYALKPRPKPRPKPLAPKPLAKDAAIPLRFGATSTHSNLMNKVEATWNKLEDDEFDSFQQAGVRTEMAANNLPRTALQNDWSTQSPLTPTPRNPPPGFTGLVLTPNSTGKKVEYQMDDSLI